MDYPKQAGMCCADAHFVLSMQTGGPGVGSAPLELNPPPGPALPWPLPPTTAASFLGGCTMRRRRRALKEISSMTFISMTWARTAGSLHSSRFGVKHDDFSTWHILCAWLEIVWVGRDPKDSPIPPLPWLRTPSTSPGCSKLPWGWMEQGFFYLFEESCISVAQGAPEQSLSSRNQACPIVVECKMKQSSLKTHFWCFAGSPLQAR